MTLPCHRLPFVCLNSDILSVLVGFCKILLIKGDFGKP